MFLSAGPLLVMVAAAATVAVGEFVSSGQRGTSFLVRFSSPVLLYGLTNALMAGFVAGALQGWLATKGIRIFDPTPIGYLSALLVGSVLPGLLAAELIAGTDIGLKVVMLAFKAPLKEKLLILEHDRALRYVAAAAARHTDIAAVKRAIVRAIPETLPTIKTAPFRESIATKQHVDDALAACLGFLGRESFERLFGEEVPAMRALPRRRIDKTGIVALGKLRQQQRRPPQRARVAKRTDVIAPALSIKQSHVPLG